MFAPIIYWLMTLECIQQYLQHLQHLGIATFLILCYFCFISKNSFFFFSLLNLSYSKRIHTIASNLQEKTGTPKGQIHFSNQFLIVFVVVYVQKAKYTDINNVFGDLLFLLNFHYNKFVCFWSSSSYVSSVEIERMKWHCICSSNSTQPIVIPFKWWKAAIVIVFVCINERLQVIIEKGWIQIGDEIAIRWRIIKYMLFLATIATIRLAWTHSEIFCGHFHW